jgi:hypothetical protein
MSEVYLAVDDFFYNPYLFIVKDRLVTIFTTELLPKHELGPILKDPTSRSALSL